MECPFLTPIYKVRCAGGYDIRDDKHNLLLCNLTKERADYTVIAVNSHEKLYNLLQGAYGYIPEGDSMQKAIKQALEEAEEE